MTFFPKPPSPTPITECDAGMQYIPYSVFGMAQPGMESTTTRPLKWYQVPL